MTSFLFSFFTPYLLNPPYADLQSKVGLIYGSIAVCSFFFAFFCVPEMKGRSLEDINEMFEQKVPVRKFRTFKLEHTVGKLDEQNDQGTVGEKNAVNVTGERKENTL